MNPKIIWLRTAGLVLMMPAAVALAQMPPAPKPGPEHEFLKRDVGVWDATVEMQGPPGTPPAVSKGTETVGMAVGGLWQTTQFKGDLMGQVFEGQGIMGYDPAKKKYVGSWVDSMSSGLSLVEGTYDAAKNVFTGTMEGPGPTGDIVKMKQVVEWKDADTRVFTMHMPLPDGTEFPGLKISYKRRK
jgi:hypothetical protein